jgi:hypothetical protein
VEGNGGASSGASWSISSRPVVLQPRLGATGRITRNFRSRRRPRSTTVGVGAGQRCLAPA